MATLSFGVEGPNQSWVTSLQINDTDSPRIIAWLMSPVSGFGTVTENVVTGEGEEATQAWVTRQATPEEATQNYARAQLRSLLASTVEHERAEAARAAAAAIPAIEPA